MLMDMAKKKYIKDKLCILFAYIFSKFNIILVIHSLEKQYIRFNNTS